MLFLNNSMFSDLIYLFDIENNEKLKKRVKLFEKIVISKIKIVDGCVLIDINDKFTNNYKFNFDIIASMYGDITGYEASRNEIRLIDYIDLNDINIDILSFKILESLKKYLKKNFPNKKFCIYVFLKSLNTEIRFHVLRENEVPYLNEDLDDYDVPVIVEKF